MTRRTEGLLHRMFVPERILPETLEQIVGASSPDGKTEWFVVSERMNNMFKEQMQGDLLGLHQRILSEQPGRTLGSREEVTLGALMGVYCWLPQQGFKLLRWGFRKSPKVTLAALAVVLIQAFGALNPVVPANTPLNTSTNANISSSQ